MPAQSAELPPRMNHVYVDFENVHEVDLNLIGTKTVSFTLLLGARQTKLNVDLVEKLMKHASSVQLVRLTSSGKNALDFALAYYVGRDVMTDPAGYFHIVSKDTGFDPLIEHLRSRSIAARRHDDFSALSFTPTAKPPANPPEDLMSRAVEHLRKHPNNRPKRKKTLTSHLSAHFGKTVAEADVLKLIVSLSNAGHLNIGDKDAVTYQV